MIQILRVSKIILPKNHSAKILKFEFVEVAAVDGGVDLPNEIG